MFLPDKKDAIHKAWLYRTLSSIAEDNFLASVLYFKGGTYAAMRGWLDRFSIDLNFDFMGRKNQINKTKRHLEKIFDNLDLKIKDSSQKGIQYFLQYQTATKNQRNILKIDTFFPPLKKCNYETVRLIDIDKILNGQTKETMFANKLIALKNRFDQGKTIAGRDLYDIHHFFLQGFDYDQEIIENYAGKDIDKFISEIIKFIKTKVTQRTIDQDINFLLSPTKFQQIRKIIKPETIMFLKDEMGRTDKG